MLAALTAVIAFGAIAVPARADFGLDRPPVVTFHEPANIRASDAYAIDPDTFEAVRDSIFYPLVPDTTAGSHPDMSVDLSFNVKPDGIQSADGNARDIDVDLPAGFYGNPANRPTCDPVVLKRSFGAFCNPDSQVGAISVIYDNEKSSPVGRLGAVFPVFNMRTGSEDTAILGFSFSGISVLTEVTPRTESDGGLQAVIRGLTAFPNTAQARLTLWGNPSDPRHDRLREYGVPGTDPDVGNPSTAPPLPFLATPARCDAPLDSAFRIRSWQRPDETLSYSHQMPARTGCDQLSFDASLRAAPTSPFAGQPTGLGVDLDVPQTNSAEERVTPQVKDVTVKLPEGLTISPGGANGLEACSDAQLGKGSRGPEACPERSRVGTATITTPVFDEKLEGSVYLGSQLSSDPASGDMYRLFVVAYVKGVRVKLVGRVKADPATGQLTTVFAQNPQLPFSNLRLDLKDGPRALLANPRGCGTSKVALDASSYAGTAVAKQSDFTVNQGCAVGGFGPSFVGGTRSPFAGAASPLVTSFARPDGQDDLKGVRLALPQGLLGNVGSVPLCGAAQAQAGTCDDRSRVGTTRVAVGSGSAPFSLPGVIHLAGPYKGQPYSLSIVVRAIAGPLDLGTVVVRAPLVIDANNAQVTAPVDELPQILGGVPLRYRTIDVNLDRPNFTFNATNCSAWRFVTDFVSVAGRSAPQGVPYRPKDCGRLRVAPKLTLSYTGGEGGRALKKDQNARLTANLTQRRGQANLDQVRVTLPEASALRPENAGALCQPAQVRERNCPRASIVGSAAARTPALPGRLAGPVYLVQGFRTNRFGRTIRTLPNLYVKLTGSGVTLDLNARSSITGGKRLTAKFTGIPDAPIDSFRLIIDGGRKGILANTVDICDRRQRADVGILGQNNRRTYRTLTIDTPQCRK